MNDNRMPPFFIADDKALDFLNSTATPADVKIEWLSSGEDFLQWLRDANLVPEDVLESLKQRAVPGELDAVAGQARALREWFRQFVHAHRGKPLRANVIEELGPLNQVLARDEEFGQILPSGQGRSAGLEWRLQRRWRSPDTLLLPIARLMAELVTTADFTYVKRCENPTCSLMFVDKSHRHSRRWCSMAACGNRAKQAAYRARVQRDED